MGLIRDETGRLHIETPLMAESLMDKTLLEGTETEQLFRPLPGLKIVKLGGQSIIDRGRSAVLPLLEEIISARAERMSGTCASTLKEHTISNVSSSKGRSVADPSFTSSPRSRASSSMPGDRSTPLALRQRLARRSSIRPVPQPTSRMSSPAP